MNPFRQSRLLIGMALIMLGVLFILMNVGVIESIPFSYFWPVILMLVGVGKLFQAENGKARWDGIWLILVGVWLQVATLKLFDLTFRNSWPLVLVVWGIYLTGAALTRKPHVTLVKENSNGN